MRRNLKHIFVLSSLLVICIFPELSSGAEEKIKIDDVKISGNSVYSDSRLYQVILSRPSSFLSPSYYYEEVLEDDLRNLELFYHHNGYLETLIQTHTVSVDTAEHLATIKIVLTEGPVTLVEGISVLGNVAFTDEQLIRKLKIKSGDALIRKKIDDSNIAILTLYAEHGYLDAEVVPEIKVNSETHMAVIDFRIIESRQYTVGNIDIAGLDKTEPDVVLRELSIRRGEIINYSEILESQRNLYLTGLFESVFIRPVKPANADSAKKDIRIEIKENDSGEFNVSVGYGTVDRFRTRMEVFNNNLFGTARKIGFQARLSFINRVLEASFTEPWTFGTPWRSDVVARIESADEPGYDLTRWGGEATIGRSFLKISKITLTYRHENVSFSNIKISRLPLNVKTKIRSLKLTYTNDSRNNLFNTTQGQYFEWSNELAGAFLTGTNTFARSIVKYKYFYSWTTNTVFATALEFGWMDASGGIDKIPLNERFYAGGPNSLRGFEYQRLGPLDENRFPLGGRLKLVVHALEIRTTIYKIVGGVVFFEFGNVWHRPDEFRIKELRPVAGMGVRVNTIIGLISLDYGFNLYPKTKEPGGQFFLNLGQAF